jgi:stearoyl-CoA desaturase (delta-9 desaturase)
MGSMQMLAVSAPADPYRINGLIFDNSCDPGRGEIVWDRRRSLWNGGMLAAAAVLGPIFFSWSAVAVFLGLSAVTLCCGHSVGFHRRLIHRSFKCPKPLERILVYLGTVVGMGGPLWTIRTHDMRDWAQRSPACHPFFAHKAGVWRDAWWYLHCRIVLAHPPRFDPGPGFGDDKFYLWLDRTAMLQQLPIAAVLLALGGLDWVVWGVCVRVAACTTMHWYISRLAHTRGPQSWMVDGVGTMGHDVPLFAIPTMGESWHNNHHAFPASARHGLFPGQFDPGFRFIQLLAWLGLAGDIRTPETLPARPGVRSLIAASPEVAIGPASTVGR